MKYLFIMSLFSFVSSAWSQAEQEQTEAEKVPYFSWCLFCQAEQEQTEAEKVKEICAGATTQDSMDDCLRESTEWLQIRAEEATKICAGATTQDLMKDCLREATEWLQGEQSKTFLEEPFPCEYTEGMETARNILSAVYKSDVTDKNNRVYALYINKCPFATQSFSCQMSQRISVASNAYYIARNALEADGLLNSPELEEIKKRYLFLLFDFYTLTKVRTELIISDFQGVFREIHKAVSQVWDSFSDTANQVKEAFENTNHAIQSFNNSHGSVDIGVIEDTNPIIENIENRQADPVLLPLYEKFHEIYAKHYLKCGTE